ncbi:MAG: hypothetical protein CMD68_05555 [Gammaproteobacteria bacterium]|nr:hypothetical protein [Gammaproteobacteria bacterium]
MKLLFILSLLTISSLASSIEEQVYLSEDREPCSVYVENKIPLFGDLHVHTALSLDANTQGTILTPEDAYLYAKGQSLYLQPYRSDGTSKRVSKLKKPLDFAAVTDHAELLGEVRMCTDSNSQYFNNLTCKLYRNFQRLSYFYINAKASLGKSLSMCGNDREFCLAEAQIPWSQTIEAAEKHYDRTEECNFTSFIGYEWTGAVYSGSNLHRNIIFENSNVPFLPVSFLDAPSRQELWSKLDKECIEDCNYIVIPHNSNLSNGFMFEEPNQDELFIQNIKEPLIEIFQHKGSSECALNEEDPLCSFEQLPYKDFRAKFSNDLTPAPNSSFVRDALNKGLKIKENSDINPFKYGFIGSTDTHLATPGATDEEFFQGHGGAGKSFRNSIPQGLPDDIEFNPGGLAVVWAEENSRSSIFKALQRKEVYGTSGPRFLVRFFAGNDFNESLCDSPDAISQAYEDGVPMGASIDASSLSNLSLFMTAQADADLENQYLEKIQVIKGVLKDDEILTTIIDVANHEDTTLEDSSCNVLGKGKKSICAVWQDPNFDNQENAYYYLRVVANKSCRWSHQLCLSNPDYCIEESDFETPKFIQERAWTSPIWLENN